MATRRVTTEKLPVLDFRKTQKDRLQLLALPPIYFIVCQFVKNILPVLVKFNDVHVFLDEIFCFSYGKRDFINVHALAITEKDLFERGNIPLDSSGGMTGFAYHLLNRNATWYLCPLATKTQALGFCLFYLAECQGKPISIIYPFGKNYSAETGTGISRCWRYIVEFEYLSGKII